MPARSPAQCSLADEEYGALASYETPPAEGVSATAKEEMPPLH